MQKAESRKLKADSRTRADSGEPLLSAFSFGRGQFLTWKSAARCGTFTGVLVCAFALLQSDRHSTDVARCLIEARRLLRCKPLYRKHLRRPIFALRINHCRITAYIQSGPFMGAAYCGGNASRKALWVNDVRHACPQQWLFFGPRKPRKNSEGVL